MIVHVLQEQNFSGGYIRFMIEKMGKFEHRFIVIKNKKGASKFEKPDEGAARILYVDRLDNQNGDVIRLLSAAQKVIVTGVFNGIEKQILKFGKQILSKTYFQFWGGDFYSYRGTRLFSRKQLRKMRLHKCIRRCAGVITLIPEDYEELSKIFPNKTAHFVASVPYDPREKHDYRKYIKNGRKRRVLLGNSATIDNGHLEALEALRHLAGQGIEVVCPLSYGDKEYARKVAAVGKEYFGNNFHAIIDYMDYESYMKLIGTCGVGIFNNNRQQALGNIGAMLMMGKKVYLREGTSMWKNYRSLGIKVYPVSDIKSSNSDEIFGYDKMTARSNDLAIRKKDRDYAAKWSIILGGEIAK